MHGWTRFCCGLALLLAIFVPSHSATTVNAKADDPQLSAQIGIVAPTAEQITSPVAPIHSLELQSTIATMVQQAELIVRGRVTDVQSFWRADQRLIESTTQVQVSYTVLGHAARYVTIHTAGGFLPREGIGMVSMHAASFARGEEVLLFLQRQGVTWQMVDGAAGKFLIQDKEIINRDWAVAMPVDGFLAAVTRQSTDRKTVSAFATLAQQLAPPTQPTPLPIYFATSSSMGTVHKWLTPHASATYLINLNSSQLANSSDHDADSIGLRNAIIAAASQWSAVATADFSLRYGGETAATATGYNGANEILFMHKGIGERAAAAEVWYRTDGTIVEADIWINDDYRWDTTGTPAARAVDLQSALLHEFGHWLILGHTADAQSIMYPKMAAGSVKRTLQSADIAGISTIYPR